MENVIDLLAKAGITARLHHGAKGLWKSPCPGCGCGNDRFHVFQHDNDGNGAYWCRQCGKKGDSIQFLIDFEHLTFRDACARLGISRDAKLVPRYVPPSPKPPAVAEPFRPAAHRPLPEAWQKKAMEFVRWCHDQMMASPEAGQWFKARGFTLATARRYCLGFNPGAGEGKPFYKSRAAWGLAEEKRQDGRVKPLWLPVGWVIPVFAASGQVIRIRIRRTDADIAKLYPDMKYYVVPGSAGATLVLGEAGARAHLLVESELDAMLCQQEADKDAAVGANGIRPDQTHSALLSVICTGSSGNKPDAAAMAALAGSHCLLDAMDADQPGQEGGEWWRGQFPRIYRRWPVPAGKDPGDAWKAGVDLRQWMIAGLPIGLRPAAISPVPLSGENDDVGANCLRPVEAAALQNSESSEGNLGELHSPRLPAQLPSDGNAADLPELAGIMARYGVVIEKNGGEVRIHKLEACPPLLRPVVSRLVFLSEEVGRAIDNHPRDLIFASNLLQGARR